MAEPLRVVFMGSDPVALPLLDWLAGAGQPSASLVGIVTGPDRPSGRGQAVRPNAVKAWSGGRALEVHQPEKLGAPELAALRDLRPDVALVVAYGHILREEFISAPRLGTLNVHASLLPKYRGASPIQTAVACGESETGMTLMRIVRELDAGPLAATEKVAIGPLDTAETVERRMAEAAVPLLAGALPRLAAGSLEFREQDHSKASYCRRLAKADGGLDFTAPASVLAARINGLFPWPSASIEVSGVSIRLGLAEAVQSAPGSEPGTVTGSDGEGLRVATGSGELRLRRLQRAGGRMLGASEFLLGFPITAGTAVTSGKMQALVSDSPVPALIRGIMPLVFNRPIGKIAGQCLAHASFDGWR